MAVARGQVLVVLEAMKTVFRLAAPADGIVATVSCRVGDAESKAKRWSAFAEATDARNCRGLRRDPRVLRRSASHAQSAPPADLLRNCGTVGGQENPAGR